LSTTAKMTLAGQRSSTVAELIANIGATNQLQDNILDLVLGGAVRHSDSSGGGMAYKNAVLDDKKLPRCFKSINLRFGDFCLSGRRSMGPSVN